MIWCGVPNRKYVTLISDKKFHKPECDLLMAIILLASYQTPAIDSVMQSTRQHYNIID